MKKTLAFLVLAGCGGCEYATYQAIAERPELLEMYEIVYWPMIKERTEFPEEVDVTLVEGLVETKKQYEMLVEARRRSKILISLGMCSSFSGVPGLVYAYGHRKAIKEIYGREPEEMGTEDIRPVLPKSVPEVIPVDYIISHCPPIPEHIYATLKDIYEGRRPRLALKTVCSECPRKMKPVSLDKFKKPPKKIDPDVCFLSQGILCLGPVTASGCGARCPRAGVPCYGCAGPTRDILIHDKEDIPIKLAREIAGLAGMDPEKDVDKVLEVLKKAYGEKRFYTFTLGSVFFKFKPRSTAMRLILRGEESD